MTAHLLRINTWDDVPRAIATMQLSGAAHRVPVLQALHAGRIGTWEPQRAGCTGRCKRFLATVCKPALIIIGDDDDAPTDPDGWPVAERLLRWARQVILHGAGGHPSHYEGAVMAAEVVGRLLLVECTSGTLEAWKAAARRWATQAIIQAVEVPPLAVHPSPVRQGDLH